MRWTSRQGLTSCVDDDVNTIGLCVEPVHANALDSSWQHQEQCVPHFRIISSSGEVGAVRGEGRGGDIIIVPLLLQDVALTAPLPDQQLPQGCTPEGNPVPSPAESDGVDG